MICFVIAGIIVSYSMFFSVNGIYESMFFLLCYRYIGLS